MLQNIFDLPNSVEELPKLDVGYTDLFYQEVRAKTTAIKASFPGSAKRFEFSMDSGSWWIPFRSYFRIRMLLGRTTTEQLTRAENIAPAWNICGQLFQSARLEINNTQGANIDTFLPQIDALFKRVTKSQTFFKNLGISVNFYDSSFTNRLNDICSDGFHNEIENKVLTAQTLAQVGLRSDTQLTVTAATNLGVFSSVLGLPDIRTIYKPGDSVTTVNDTYIINSYGNATGDNPNTSVIFTVVGADQVATAITASTITRSQKTARRVYGFECLWQPPFDIFVTPYGLPTGNYQLVMTPFNTTDYKYKIAQSTEANKVPGTNFDFSLEDIAFYVARCEGPVRNNVSYYMRFDELECVSDDITSVLSNQEKTFSVSTSARKIAVAFQDRALTGSTLHKDNLFKIGTADGELDITGLQITYAGQVKPQIRADCKEITAESNLQQRYMDSMIYSGQYFREGGVESYEDFKRLGPFYYFDWPKPGSNTSTNVRVRFSFSSDQSAGQVLLFHYKTRIMKMDIVDGVLKSVKVDDV